jgi:hypothetical protein
MVNNTSYNQSLNPDTKDGQNCSIRGRRIFIMRFITWGAIGAAIYGVVRVMRNGSFQQLAQNIPGKLKVQNLKQMAQPLQQMTQPLQGMAKNPLNDSLPKQQGF